MLPPVGFAAAETIDGRDGPEAVTCEMDGAVAGSGQRMVRHRVDLREQALEGAPRVGGCLAPSRSPPVEREDRQPDLREPLGGLDEPAGMALEPVKHHDRAAARPGAEGADGDEVAPRPPHCGGGGTPFQQRSRG